MRAFVDSRETKLNSNLKVCKSLHRWGIGTGAKVLYVWYRE